MQFTPEDFDRFPAPAGAEGPDDPEPAQRGREGLTSPVS